MSGPINPQRSQGQEKDKATLEKDATTFFPRKKKKTPKNIIQNLSLVTWLLITLRIIITIFRINRIRNDNLRNQKYQLEEIVEDQETINRKQQFENPFNVIANLDKIREENWELSQIKLRTEILLEKIERKIREKEKYFEQTFHTKKRKSNRS